MEERCVMCGAIIPEGKQVCPICEAKTQGDGNDIRMVVDSRILCRDYIRDHDNCPYVSE